MIATQHSLPLFFQFFWLDAVAGAENWDVVLSLDAEGNPKGVWPYVIKQSKGLLKVNVMPPLTPYLGPWLFYPEKIQTRQKKFQFEEKILPELVAQLPSVFLLQQKCHPRFFNWMPLYWLGFQQTTRFTYRIEPGSSTDKIFNASLRSDISRSRKKMEIQVLDNPELFYEINVLSFTQQGRPIPYDLSFFLRLDASLSQRGQREITAIFDQNGEPMGALYLIWDIDTAYYLASGIDRSKHPSGVMSYLLAVAIEKTLKEGKTFDFEGSMIPGVEQFFRSFGGKLTPYYQITKGRNRWVEALKLILTGKL